MQHRNVDGDQAINPFETNNKSRLEYTSSSSDSEDDNLLNSGNAYQAQDDISMFYSQKNNGLNGKQISLSGESDEGKTRVSIANTFTNDDSKRSKKNTRSPKNR